MSPMRHVDGFLQLAREVIAGGREIAPWSPGAASFHSSGCVEFIERGAALVVRDRDLADAIVRRGRDFRARVERVCARTIPCSTGPSTATRRPPAHRRRSAGVDAVRAVSVCGPPAGRCRHRQRPAAVGIRTRAPRGARQCHGDFLARVGAAPDLDRPVALQDHVIGEQRRPSAALRRAPCRSCQCNNAHAAHASRAAVRCNIPFPLCRSRANTRPPRRRSQDFSRRDRARRRARGSRGSGQGLAGGAGRRANRRARSRDYLRALDRGKPVAVHGRAAVDPTAASSIAKT